MVSNEAIVLGTFADTELKLMLEKLATNSKSYLDNSFKAAANAPMKTTLTKGVAAGIASLGGEVYDYTKDNNPKELTKDNLYKSATNVTSDAYKGLLFGNTNIGTTIIGNSLVDKAVTGESNLEQNAVSGIEGEIIDKLIPTVPGREFIIEGSQKFLNKGIIENENKEEYCKYF
ncbi:hypothetical protein [Avibacterium endocarditidis]|uniref:Toxin CdiA n=1 Tax=Avibacterium endocarditidis TaxID=380674 RepID=A0ABX4ZT75_9PAST|nr:hypothetical protein [Avibacterium endocarditidis]POY42415.1 hypothetical protein C3Z13_05640 [Avibacterium endocarditidis]